MKSRTTRPVKVFVLIGLSLFLVSCGASKVAKNSGSSTYLSSRANDSIAPRNFQGLVSDCNGIQTSEMRMAVASYVDSYSGEAIPEYVQMRILDLPDSFYSSSGTVLSFYRWKASAGSRYNDSTPVTLKALSLSNQYMQAIDLGQEVTATSLSSIISNAYGSSTSITVDNFFQYHYIIAVFPSADALSYTAMQMTISKSESDNNELIAAESFLIPQYYSDPNLFMSIHSLVDLQVIHPNFNLASAGYTETQYQSATQDYCQWFFIQD